MSILSNMSKSMDPAGLSTGNLLRQVVRLKSASRQGERSVAYRATFFIVGSADTRYHELYTLAGASSRAQPHISQCSDQFTRWREAGLLVIPTRESE